MSAARMDRDSRTVVVSGVPAALPDSRMADKLTIHFQSGRRSRGGDVEVVMFPTNIHGVAFVTFDKAEDADRVVGKKEHIMKDEEFPEDYALTVFPFSTDVFLYVPGATVDLSVFGSDQASLIERLRSTHRSIRFRSIPDQRKAIIEGPLSAVKALSEDLNRKTKLLKPPTQTLSTKPKETICNSMVLSQHETIGSAGFSGTKAKQKPAGSSSLLKAHLSTGEAREAHRLGSEPEVGFNQSLTAGSLRQVIGEESNEGTRFVSGLGPDSVKEKSTKPEKHNRSEWNSAAKTRGEDQSDLQRTTYRDISTSSMSRGDHTKGYSGDTCVDLYTFKYAQKFHKKELDGCLEGVNLSVERVKGTDLIWVSLTEKELSKAGSSALRMALENFKILMNFLMAILRVQTILYDKETLLNKQELTSICDEVNSLYSDVLYIVKDSCIKVIGPSESSHMFCRTVEVEMSKLKVQHANPTKNTSWRKR